MRDLINREEIRRLQKAARDNNKHKLYEWLERYTDAVDNCFRQDYENQYKDEVQNSIDNMLIAILYTLYYSEENYINKDNIHKFMSDLFSTFDMYRTGQYKPEEFKQNLESLGIKMEYHDLDKVYKKYVGNLNSNLVSYLKSKHKPIVTICGNLKYKEEILKQQELLTLDGYIVFTPGVFNLDNDNQISEDENKLLIEIQKEKILMSNMLFVVNIDNIIDKSTQDLIDYAKQLNITVKYLNNISQTYQNQK